METGVMKCRVLAAAMYLAVLSALCASNAATLDDVPWIGDGRPERNGADWYEEDPAPEFMAEFVLPEGVSEAKVHFACVGFGWFGINGAYMSADGLDALWSVYDKTIYSTKTRTLKATHVLNVEMIEKGFELESYPATNRVHVRLGNGFYNLPPLRFWGSKCFRESLAHGRPCFKLYIDGVDKPLEWKWRETDVVRNSVYLGSEVDATRFTTTMRDFAAERRAENERWKPAAVVKGPKGKIVEWPRGNPRMGTFDIHDGEAKWLKEGEVQVVDFGMNAAGVPTFMFRDEPRSNRVEIIYGERLNADGTVNPLTQTAGQIKRPGMGGPGAPDLACQRDVYICRGPQTLPPMTWTSADLKSEVFSPRFTWHVFRYAEIRGAKHLVTYAHRNVRSMLPSCFAPHEAKDFKADNPDLAAIHEICRRTFQANMIGGVQSDCPGRERLGYGGDIVATYEAYMMNWDMCEIYLKILRDFADEAEDDGWITETAPYVGIADKGFGGRSGPISWTLAVPELMDGILRHYNDKRALGFYPVCARYVRLVAEKCPDGLVPDCIGDHEALERAPDGCTATAHWHRFVELTAKFAKMLGRTDDEKEFTALAEKIRGAFVAAYVKDGVVANGTQSAQSIGLYLGLVPEDQSEAALARLVAAVEEKGCGPTTGIFSTRYMLMYLSENGRVDLARKIVLHKGFPGWLHMIERGATTLWETWKESDDVYSNCHPMFGSVDEWILKYGGKRK
jgi:alpha-L-rhamnosidase